MVFFGFAFRDRSRLTIFAMKWSVMSSKDRLWSMFVKVIMVFVKVIMMFVKVSVVGEVEMIVLSLPFLLIIFTLS